MGAKSTEVEEPLLEVKQLGQSSTPVVESKVKGPLPFTATGIVPLLLGRKIVRTAVGSLSDRVVVKPSPAIAPSKVRGLPPCSMALTVSVSVEELPRVVLPLAFRSPLTPTDPPKVVLPVPVKL